MEEIKVTAELRDKIGVKGALSGMRAEKKIPAVVYGNKKEPLSIVISEKDLANIQKAGVNAIIALTLPSGVETAIIKEVQYHVVKDVPIHIDFQRISMSEKIEVVVPVKLTGESADVKMYGALINQTIRELVVRCLPGKIPHEIDVDITKLTITDSIYVSNLDLGKDVEVVGDEHRVIVSLIIPREEEAAAAPADAAAQPESSSTKGKKEEEKK
ncbi:large subunit ribosomal protein L25 [Parelusimicrobium proximum]|uniref:50S ribosomal protein L25 n=1 Tax=Parelusimicrobium proximum TaxID=3228953 RepID=UPI003D17AF6A